MLAQTFDAWGEPIYANTDPMQGPAQISEAAKLSIARGIRHFDTQALLLAATGMLVDYYAIVKSCPGALWRYDGVSAWLMTGTAVFATAAARDAALTAPVAGMKCLVTSDATSDNNGEYVYFSGWKYVTPKIVNTIPATAGVAPGTTIATIVIAAVAQATTVDVDVDATIGNSSGTTSTGGIDMAVTAGTLTKNYVNTNHPTITTGLYTALARSATIAIPANTAVTLTVTTAGSIAGNNIIFNGRIKTTRR